MSGREESCLGGGFCKSQIFFLLLLSTTTHEPFLAPDRQTAAAVAAAAAAAAAATSGEYYLHTTTQCDTQKKKMGPSSNPCLPPSLHVRAKTRQKPPPPLPPPRLQRDFYPCFCCWGSPPSFSLPSSIHFFLSLKAVMRAPKIFFCFTRKKTHTFLLLSKAFKNHFHPAVKWKVNFYPLPSPTPSPDSEKEAFYLVR